MVLVLIIFVSLICWPNISANDGCSQHVCNTNKEGYFCSHTCSLGSADSLDLCLGHLQNEHNCYESPTLVSVTFSVTFPNKTIPRHWMKSSNVHPTLLKLYLDNVVHIEDHAFDSQTFARLQVLTLMQMNLGTLGVNTLHGLTALRELRLDNVRLMHLPDFLNGVANRLDRLEITGALSIDNIDLLSGVALPSLREIRLRLNARNVVGATVFQAASSLSIVDMQNCRIELISPRVFYTFRRTLMYINLVGNRLKTVSASMFDYLMPNVHLKVYLFDNPWNCECELIDFKTIVKKHPDNFPGPIVCTNPLNMMGRPIRTSSFCASSSIQEPEMDDEQIICSNEKATILDWKVGQFSSRVHRNIDMGNASFVLDPEDKSNTSRITISELNVPEIRAINECICESSSSQRYIPLSQLNPGQSYLFCMQDLEQLNPDCLAFFLSKQKRTKAVWLTNSKKATFLVGLVVAMLILMAISFLIGTIMFCKAPEKDTPNQTTVSISEIEVVQNFQTRSVNCDIDESTTQYEEIDYSYLHLATIVEPQYLAMLEPDNNK